MAEFEPENAGEGDFGVLADAVGADSGDRDVASPRGDIQHSGALVEGVELPSHESHRRIDM